MRTTRPNSLLRFVFHISYVKMRSLKIAVIGLYLLLGVLRCQNRHKQWGVHMQSFSFKTLGLMATSAVLAMACAVVGKTPLNADDELLHSVETMTRFEINGTVYYQAIAPCCDKFNPLYDERGRYVCAPTGGYTGRGDGQCPDLREALGKVNGVVVKNPFRH